MKKVILLTAGILLGASTTAAGVSALDPPFWGVVASAVLFYCGGAAKK